MIKTILTYPQDKIKLTMKSQAVLAIDDNIKQLIQDLKDTLNDTTGVGISAIQIGQPYTICIIKYNHKELTLINPTIIRTRGKSIDSEGCLSAPNEWRTVERFEKVWCQYLDENGQKREIAEGGLCSRIIQHELDHFNGWCEVFNNIKEEK